MQFKRENKRQKQTQRQREPETKAEIWTLFGCTILIIRSVIARSNPSAFRPDREYGQGSGHKYVMLVIGAI